MKKARIPGFMVFVLLCIALNRGGDLLVSRLNWPIWLDSVGTVFCAYLCGPVCGALVGITSNLLGYIIHGTPWVYAIMSLLIGVIAGVAGKRKMLDTLFGTLTSSATMGIASTILAVPINIIINNGNVGNTWGDAVGSYLREQGVPSFLGLVVGQLYVEVLDKLVILLVLFLILKGIALGRKLILKQKGEPEPEPSPQGAVKAAAVLLLAAGLCISGGGSARAEDAINYNDYVQTIYSSLNGLPVGEANDIAQTRDGILWVGTYAGLYRYNGREFRWIDNYDSVRNVNCLYVDEEGRLWIGTNDNGLSIAINEQIVNVLDQNDGLPSDSIRSIIKSSDGYYYIGTTGSMQILTLSAGLRRLHTLPEIVFADDVAADGEGHVAAVTNADGKLFLMQKGQILSSRQLSERENAMFKSCCFDPEGNLLAATTENEIFVFDISRGWFELKNIINCGKLRNIKDLTYLETGELFISADDGIGYIGPDGKLRYINTNEFNNSIDNMLMDYQGNLWFTSSRLGLLRLAPSDFRDVFSTVGMENQVVNTVVRWREGYYIGTDAGLKIVDSSCEEEITNELTENFAGLRIRCMMVDSQNHLWICTHSKGVWEYETDGTEYQYNHENGAAGNKARITLELSDGTVLIGTDAGVGFIRNHRVEDRIPYTRGQINSLLLTATELEDGRILVGTDGNGLALLENRKVSKMLTREDGLSSEVILRTVRDPKTGGVYIVTSNGLCYMNIDETIRTLDNFPYYNNYDIWIKGTDTLFVMSSAGIYVVNRSELLSGKDNLGFDLLDSRRGLNSSLTANAWSCFNDATGELFLPCDTGVFVINTTHYSTSTKVYRMSVPVVKLDGEARRVDRNTGIHVTRGISRVELMPEIINYTIQDPYVGYYLEGFDQGWTIVQQNNLSTIVYTNLPSGSYVFHLAVYDNNQENIVAERTYLLYKDKEMYDNSWFIIYILSVPMFTVFWVTWLLVKRRERKMAEQLAAAEKQIEMGKQTVLAIARTVDAKDARTSEHSQRVAVYSGQIAKAYGLDDKQVRDIEWSARMHDIGKIAIPDAILNKTSRLTDEEYAIMKSHTLRGAEILEGFTLLDNVIEGAEFHHERYDGRGYPKGLKGEDIPLYARIIGVADAFDAMTANRVYRKQMDFGYVLGELEKGRGTQFDPQFVDILLKLIHEGTIDLNKLYGVTKEDSEKAEAERIAREAAKAAEAADQQQVSEALKAAEGAKEKPTETAVPAEKTPEGGDQA